MSTTEFTFTEFVTYGSILVPPGSLPFALFHGESLVACAAWALDGAEVQVVDDTVTWEGLIPEDSEDEAIALVLHDALCPGVEPAFITECVALARSSDVVVAAGLGVTDTVKRVANGIVTDTMDRDRLVQVTSPVVLTRAAIEVASTLWPGGLENLPVDTSELVARLAEHVPVHFAAAPASTARVGDKDELAVLEAATVPVDR